MADEENRSGIVAEQLLQEVERLDVEVVGRLVENEQVGRLRQRPRKHEPSTLAPGQFSDRRTGLLGREQEVAHVAHDMATLGIDRDVIAAAAGQRVDKRRRRLERGAPLIERGHCDIRAEPHRAGIGRERPGQEIDERGLARAIGATMPIRSRRITRSENR